MTRRTPAQYDWPKLQFDETILTKHFTRPRRGKIKFVVAHHMTIVGKGNGSALDACYRTWQTRQASAQYGVDGKYVRQFVWDSDAAWATGNTSGNHEGISIEHANSSVSGWLISETTWKNGAKLAAYLHWHYKLGRPTSKNNGKSGTLRKHSSFTSTACPGPYMDKIWNKYVAEAQRVYDSIGQSEPKVKVARWHGSRFLNMHGDDGGKGTETFFTRLPRMVNDLTKGKPEVVTGCEVRPGKQAAALIKAMKAKGYTGKVLDGNFLFTLDSAKITWGYSGSYILPKKVQGAGRKETLLRVRLRIGGIWCHYGVSHLDYRNDSKGYYNALRVKQAKSVIAAMKRFATSQALAYWESRTFILLDENSETWVRDKAFAPAGFKAAVKHEVDGGYTGKSRWVLETDSWTTKSDHRVLSAVYGRKV